MSGFWFRLERLLHLRSQLERLRAQELGDALREEEARREAADRALASLARTQSQLGREETGPPAAVPAGTLRVLSLTLRAAAQELEARKKDHEASEAAVRESEAELGKARQERDVLKRLRERSHDAWSRDVTRAEQKETDEHTGLRWKARGES